MKRLRHGRGRGQYTKKSADDRNLLLRRCCSVEAKPLVYLLGHKAEEEGIVLAIEEFGKITIPENDGASYWCSFTCISCSPILFRANYSPFSKILMFTFTAISVWANIANAIVGIGACEGDACALLTMPGFGASGYGFNQSLSRSEEVRASRRLWKREWSPKRRKSARKFYPTHSPSVTTNAGLFNLSQSILNDASSASPTR